MPNSKSESKLTVAFRDIALFSGSVVENIFLGGMLSGFLVGLVGCTGITDGIAEYRIVHVENKISEVLLVSAVPQNVSVNQNGARTVTLPYESRKGAFPATCELKFLVQVIEAVPCACDEKVCKVGIRPQADVHGEGSFAFRLIDTAQAPTGLGNVKVKILPVTVSVDSGSGQEGTVKTELPHSLVALVQNSDKVPVSGVKVSWRILDEVSGKDGKIEVPGKGIPCKGVVSDDQGKARCNWTLGTRVGVDRVSDTRRVEASIFDRADGADRGRDGAKEALKPAPAQFTATIKSGPATKLVFSDEYPKPLVAAGNMGPIGIYPHDEHENLAETPSFKVTLTSTKKQPGEAGVSVTGMTVTLPSRGGVITRDLWLEKVGFYFLEASGPDQSSLKGKGQDFEVIPGKAAKLIFAQQPGGGKAGAIWAQQPKVRARDVFGNEIPGFSSKVTLSTSLSLYDPGAAPRSPNDPPDLGGTLTTSGISGVATFTDLKITKAGQYRLKASSSLGSSSSQDLLGSEESDLFEIKAAAANQLVFDQDPSEEVRVGDVWLRQPRVALADAFGNRIKDSSVSATKTSVMIVIRTSTGNNPIQLLGGETTKKMVDGVADFEGLFFERAGTYTLTATGSGLLWGTSKPFKIRPGLGVKLVFDEVPRDGKAGEGLAPLPKVSVLDKYGNQTFDSLRVSLVLRADSDGDPSGGILRGEATATVDGERGTATFPGLSIRQAGVYVLKACLPECPSSVPSSVPSVLSKSFKIIHGEAERLAFIAQPGGSTGKRKAGEAFGADNDSNDPPPKVAFQDAYGNTVTSLTDDVSLTIENNPAVGKKGRLFRISTKPNVPDDSREAINVKAEGGIATFSDLAVEEIIGANGVKEKIVTFKGLTIDKVGKGYTLKASHAMGLTEAISRSFEVEAGGAKKLAFIDQLNPGDGGTPGEAGKPFAPQPKIAIRDKHDNTVTSSGVEVKLSVKEGAGILWGTGVVGGRATVTTINGIAGFEGLYIKKADTGYTLEATSTNLTKDTCNPFSIIHGPATQLVFASQPGESEVGEALVPSTAVEIRDEFDNLVNSGPDASAALTMKLFSEPGGLPEDLSGTSSVTFLGKATWGSLSINTIGEKRLEATKPDTRTTSGGTVSFAKKSDKFTVGPGVPARVEFLQQPKGGRAGIAWDLAPEVVIKDKYGNRTSSSLSVTVTLESPPGVELFPRPNGQNGQNKTATVTAVNGVASFRGLFIKKVGVGYVLKASAEKRHEAGLLGPVPSSPFNITAGDPKELVFRSKVPGTEPGRVTAGAPFASLLGFKDGFENEALYEGKVTLKLGKNNDHGVFTAAEDGTMSGVTEVSASGGVVNFKDLLIKKAGVGYKLEASGEGLTSAESKSFDVEAGIARKLGFISPPSGARADASWDLKVAVQDEFGNTVRSSSRVELKLEIDPSSQVVLLGTLEANAQEGVASFSGLSIRNVGTYVLAAASSGLARGRIENFKITHGPASKLFFTTQPGGKSRLGKTLTVQPVVEIQDLYGNAVISGADAGAKLEMKLTQGSGTLSGGTEPTEGIAQSGRATWSTLAVSAAGKKVLQVTKPDRTSAGGTGPLTMTSDPFNIDSGPPERLAFSGQLGNGIAGIPWTLQPKVLIQDASGNTATTAEPVDVTLTIKGSTATLSGGATKQATNGEADFAGKGLFITKAGKYTLEASGGGWEKGFSNEFTIKHGEANKLSFIVQPPVTVKAGEKFTPPPKVAVQDEHGNVVEDSSVRVKLEIRDNPGNGVLKGEAEDLQSGVPAVNGVATLGGFFIEKAGNDYTLTASSPNLTSVGSGKFSVTAGDARKLAFVEHKHPGDIRAGEKWGDLQVAVLDEFNNTVRYPQAEVTLKLASGLDPNPEDPPLIDELLGEPKAMSVGGVAFFTNELSVKKVGVNYILLASSPNLKKGRSKTFDVTHGPAAQLAFVSQPGGAFAGAPFGVQPEVEIQDTYGNKVRTGVDSMATLTMNLALPNANIPSTGTLSGVLTSTAAFGTARWTNLAIDLTGEKALEVIKQSLISSGGTGLLKKGSDKFTVRSGAPNKLAFEPSPGGGKAGEVWSQQPKVSIKDSAGNLITDPIVVSLSIGTNPGKGGTLSVKQGTIGVSVTDGVATTTTVGGVAEFKGLSINKSGEYTLKASIQIQGVAVEAGSLKFEIIHGPATQLVFNPQPSGVIAGKSFTAQVEIQDVHGNIVDGPDATAVLTMRLLDSDMGTLEGATTTDLSRPGVTKWTALSIKLAGRKILKVEKSGSSLTVNSDPFNLAPDSAPERLRLEFANQPKGGKAGEEWTADSTPSVVVKDVHGNVVTTFSAGVKLAIEKPLVNGAPSDVPLFGTTTVPASNGRARFPGLSIKKTGDYTLKASIPTLPGIEKESDPFTITSESARSFAFTSQPGETRAGKDLTPIPTVTVKDGHGNILTLSATVTLELSGPGPSENWASYATQTGVGVVSFPGLSIKKVGLYKLRASVSGLSDLVLSNSFEIINGPAKELVFMTQPGTSIAGEPVRPSPVVEIRDAYENKVTKGADAAATLEMSLNPGTLEIPSTGTLTGTTATATLGGATWNNLLINLKGKKKLKVSMTNSEGTLLTATSGSFEVNPGVLSVLKFETPLGGGKAGEAWNPPPVVKLEDASGNAITDLLDVNLSIETGPSEGALSVTGTSRVRIVGKVAVVEAIDGAAKFERLSINKVGEYILKAYVGAVSVKSNSFRITHGPATQLVFNPPPSGVIAGKPFTTQVEIQDAHGNKVDTGVDANINTALTMKLGSGVGTLEGAALTDVSRPGETKWTALSIKLAGKKVLKVEKPGSSPLVAEARFDVEPGEAKKLAFTSPPGGGVAGELWSFSDSPEVAVQDEYGNTVTKSTARVKLTIEKTPGTGGVLSGDSAVKAGSSGYLDKEGVAVFSNISINKTGVYTFKASSPDLPAFPGVVSGDFTITPGRPKKLVFTASPSNGSAGALEPEPVVEIRDIHDNKTFSTGTVKVTLYEDGGSAGVLLDSLSAIGGVASFPGHSVTKTGRYYLGASSGVLDAGASTSFRIYNASANKLVFNPQPKDSTAGTNFTVKVEIRDEYGNLVTEGADKSATLAMSLFSGTGPLLGTLNATASSGLAQWTLSISSPGEGKKLKVTKTSGNLLESTSDPFKIAPVAVPPPVPSDLKALAKDRKVTLTWKASTGATRYDIRRGTSPSYMNVIGASTTLSYEDSAVDNGVRYYYDVEAISEGGASGRSSKVQAMPLSTPTLSLVVNDTGGSGALVATWSSSLGASSYKVKYGKSSATDVGCSTGATSCVVGSLTPGDTYRFKVQAINDYSGEVESAEVPGIPRRAPTLSLDGTAYWQVTPTFSAPEASSYDLYYWEKAGESESSATRVSGATSGTAVTYLRENTTYIFKVTANFPNGSLSSGREEVDVRGPPFRIVKVTPNDRRYAFGGSGVSITFPNLPGATSYTLKYGFSSGSYPTTLVTLPDNKEILDETYQFDELQIDDSVSHVDRSPPTKAGEVGKGEKLARSFIAADNLYNSYPTRLAVARVIHGEPGAYSGSTVHAVGSESQKIQRLKTYYFKVTANVPVTATNPTGTVDSYNEAELVFVRPKFNRLGDLTIIPGQTKARPDYNNLYPSDKIYSFPLTMDPGTLPQMSVEEYRRNWFKRGRLNPKKLPCVKRIPYGPGPAIRAGEDWGRQPRAGDPEWPEYQKACRLLPKACAILHENTPNHTGGYSIERDNRKWDTAVGPLWNTSGETKEMEKDSTLVLENKCEIVFKVPASSSDYGKYGPYSYWGGWSEGNWGGGEYYSERSNNENGCFAPGGKDMYHDLFSCDKDNWFYVNILQPGSQSASVGTYSTRGTVLGYTGQAMKVRHGHNQALAEVAFDSAGVISPSSPVTITSVGLSPWYLGQTMAFSDFYSDSASVFVDTWYDQSGQGNHARAPSMAEQPYIVKDGIYQNKVVFEKGRSSRLSIRYPQNGSLDFQGGYTIASVSADSTPDSSGHAQQGHGPTGARYAGLPYAALPYAAAAAGAPASSHVGSPYATTPERATLDRVAAERAAEKAALERAMLDKAAAERATLDRVAADRATPERATPDRVAHGRVTPERVTPAPAFSALFPSGKGWNKSRIFNLLGQSGLGRWARGLGKTTEEFPEQVPFSERVAVLGSYDGVETSLRLNGHLAKKHVGSVLVSRSDLHIGRLDFQEQGDDVSMDLNELVIYKGALSPEEQAMIQSEQRMNYWGP